jgi:hypothetical protein
VHSGIRQEKFDVSVVRAARQQERLCAALGRGMTRTVSRGRRQESPTAREVHRVDGLLVAAKDPTDTTARNIPHQHSKIAAGGRDVPPTR